MIYHMTDWAVFLPAAAIMAIIPGANQILGLRNAALVGVRYAVAGVAGRFMAFALLVLLVAFGLGVLLARSAIAFELIKWLGVTYLLWLGITTLRNAGKRADNPFLRQGPSIATAARREFVTAITNPKALLLFAAFIPQFMPAGSGTATLVVLATTYIAVEAAAATLYVGIGCALRRSDGQLRIPYRRLDRVSGVSFLGFGAFLALTHRP